MALEYFPCYNSYLKKCEKLTDQELGRLFRSLLQYSSTGERQELAGRESIAFDFIADDIDRAKANYDAQCQKNRENGKNGGRPKNPPLSKKPVGFSETQKSQNKSESENKSDLLPPDGGRETRAKRFTPPTVEEIADYVRKRGSSVDPQGFLDFYAAKGWMIGKTPMKDWKAACRNAENWERWEKKPAGKVPYGSAGQGELGGLEKRSVARMLQKYGEAPP